MSTQQMLLHTITTLLLASLSSQLFPKPFRTNADVLVGGRGAVGGRGRRQRKDPSGVLKMGWDDLGVVIITCPLEGKSQINFY